MTSGKNKHMKTKHDPILFAADAKSCDQPPNNSIRSKWSALALGGFLFASICALSAPPAKAQCQQYDVSGQWTIQQGHFSIPVALTQKDKTVSGTAFHQSKKDSDEAYVDVETRNVHGQVTGTVEGDSFNVQINWAGGGAGAYRGKISRSGKLSGTTYDMNKPSSTARWSTLHIFSCTDAVKVEPPAPVVKPVKSSGKFPTPAPVVRPVKSTGRPKEAVPNIKASPIVLTIPVGQSHGTVTLTWDGGPDHPDAEVWMKAQTQGGEETLVVQQGKGTRTMSLQGGINYAFALKDAGEVLARTAVLTRK
jgi:hypothetical protein